MIPDDALDNDDVFSGLREYLTVKIVYSCSHCVLHSSLLTSLSIKDPK